MNIFSEYIAYLKNNPEGYWFKRKLYGWGWTPATWQGWVTLLVFIVLIVVNALRIDRASHSVSYTLINVVPQTMVLVLILVAICFLTGESPRWMWGPEDNNRRDLK